MVRDVGKGVTAQLINQARYASKPLKGRSDA
jgi:hypothetical protein